MGIIRCDGNLYSTGLKSVDRCSKSKAVALDDDDDDVATSQQPCIFAMKLPMYAVLVNKNDLLLYPFYFMN